MAGGLLAIRMQEAKGAGPTDFLHQFLGMLTSTKNMFLVLAGMEGSACRSMPGQVTTLVFHRAARSSSSPR